MFVQKGVTENSVILLCKNIHKAKIKKKGRLGNPQKRGNKPSLPPLKAEARK